MLSELPASMSLFAGAATIASAGAAIGIGNVFSSLIHSVARNPSLAKQSFGYAILGFALTEAIALFAPMMAFLILFAAMSLSDFWLSDHIRNSIMYLLIVFLPLLGSGVAVAPGASACYLRISPWISSEMFDASWGFFGDREVWERSWSGKAKTAPRIWVARGRLCPDGGALWGRAQPNRDSTPPTSSAPLYRLNHSFGLVGGTGEPRELVRCVGQRARSGHMISAVDQVGEPCDGKPSRTVRRALNSNERFTTTSLRARGARSIRKLVRLADKAATKAMLVNRVGDFGLAPGISGRFTLFQTVDFSTIFARARATTSFLAATTGILQNDLKRVIAYSTCSQLGYMIFACGISNYSPISQYCDEAALAHPPRLYEVTINPTRSSERLGGRLRMSIN
ncbi:hypothetical protein ACFE04_014826 [Oxalis oulophora]